MEFILYWFVCVLMCRCPICFTDIHSPLGHMFPIFMFCVLCCLANINFPTEQLSLYHDSASWGFVQPHLSFERHCFLAVTCIIDKLKTLSTRSDWHIFSNNALRLSEFSWNITIHLVLSFYIWWMVLWHDVLSAWFSYLLTSATIDLHPAMSSQSICCATTAFTMLASCYQHFETLLASYTYTTISRQTPFIVQWMEFCTPSRF